MNILITGAFGFVGTNLSKILRITNEHYLIAVDICQPIDHSYNKFFSWNDLGLLDWNTIDVFIHLAGKAHDTKNTTEERSYININVGLTQKIFEYFLQSNATKFVIFSSVKAVANKVQGEYLTEETEAKPLTAYGKSKLEAELYIWNRLQDLATSRLHENAKTCEGKWDIGNKEKKVYILRPCMIHGAGNKGNLTLLYKISQKGLPWPLGSFENRRSFCSIDNISFVVQQLIEREIESGTYNVADDEALSTNELISLIAKSQNKKTRIWKIPQGPIRSLARVGDFIALPLNSERLKKLTESYVVSNEKIKRALGIEKMPVTAVEGFKKTFESFRK